MTPMLANPLEIGLAKHDNQWLRVINEGYTMEPKLDGMRLLLSFNQHGRLHAAYTRSGRDVIDMIPNTWKADCPELPSWTLLDCEFGYAEANFIGIDFNQTMRVMGSGPEVAQLKARDISYPPTAFVFDILMADDSWVCDRPQAWRRDMLLSVHALRQGWPYLQATSSEPWWDEEKYTAYVDLGGEGVMLKNPAAPYIRGKRPTQTWYKVKKFTTIDVVITGFQEEQGKYQGQIGAIKFGLYEEGHLTEIGQCSGMTDEVRAGMSAAQGAFMGAVMEVRYFGLTAGTPRHPQFVGMRSDKAYNECTIDQIR